MRAAQAARFNLLFSQTKWLETSMKIHQNRPLFDKTNICSAQACPSSN
jgi:hypothetical protein